MNEPETIAKLLSFRKIAVVGISDKPERPSYQVSSFLRERGYEIIPVNPNILEWRREKSYPSVHEIPEGIKVEVVDVFRKPAEVMGIAEEAIQRGVKGVWFQEGVINEEAADKAEWAGLMVVMDRCMKKELLKQGSILE